MAANTARRRRRQQRRRLAALATVAASSMTVRATNSTVEWHYPPGSAALTTVEQCGDGQAFVLSAAESSMAGVVNASASFKGSFIDLYGIRYQRGAAALIVVDGDYTNAVHIDESLAASNGQESDSCIHLARFADLTSHTMHTVEVVLQGDSVAPMTFTIANVTTSASSAPPQQGGDTGSGGGQPNHSGPVASTKGGPNLVAIAGPIAAVVVVVLIGVVLWLLRRRRIRNAAKAPSAAFRAQHPDLLPRVQTPDEAGLEDNNRDDQASNRNPVVDRFRQQHSHHPMAGGSSGSSVTTLVGLSYGDEKKKLAEILAVRDAEELELQQRERQDIGRVPWDPRARGASTAEDGLGPGHPSERYSFA